MSTKTWDMLEAAFQKAKHQRDAFNRERAKGLPSKIQAWRAPDVSARGIVIADDNEAAVQNVRKAKTRIIEQRLPAIAPPKKRTFETQNVTADGSVQRQIAKMPITFPQAVYGELEEMLRSLKHTGKFSTEKRIAPQIAQKPTNLDKACESYEMEALTRYVYDNALEIRAHRIRQDMIPHDAWLAIDRNRHVHMHMIREDKDDLRLFLVMCGVPINDNEPLTTREFGGLISKSGARDFCEGAATGALRKIGQRLAHLYVRWKQEYTAEQSRRKKQERIHASIRHTLTD